MQIRRGMVRSRAAWAAGAAALVLVSGGVLSAPAAATAGTGTGSDNGWAGRGATAHQAEAGNAPASGLAATALPAGYPINGIDVSSNDHPHGATVDWAAQRRGGDEFAYVKATEGTGYNNPFYSQDYNGAKAAGLYVGGYAYGRPDKGNPVGQANYFVDHIHWVNDGFTLPPFLDMEWPYASLGLPDCYGLSQSAMRSWISSFLTQVQARVGKTPMIYTNVNWWNPCTGSSTAFGGYLLDISSCNSSPPSVPGWGNRWTLWQYDIPDCHRGGVHDSDVFNGTLADLAELAGGSTGPAYVAEPGDVDVNGDGKADLVAQNAESTWVMTSTGSAYAAPAKWSNVAFYGDTANHVGDVNGDGKADLVAQNAGSTWVMTSTGSGFSTPVNWSSGAFYGELANHIGDVNGDHKADLVAQNAGSTWVMTSTGSGFSTPVNWSNVAFYGELANHIGDVNGDGKADLVAQNADSTWVMTSTGSGFAAPVKWSGMAFYGDAANHIGDVNGDHKADLVAQNAGSTWVMTSTGSSFSTPVNWSSGAFYGDVANHIGDVNGDGRDDLTAQNTGTTWVMTSTPGGYTAPVKWSEVAFYGGVANHG
jgi:GH25 family lysozyme M1 (1,4-beta-N-acetylmuramidase)